MSAAAATPPQRHRLSVADYHRMAEAGIFSPDARVELIEGEIIDMSPTGIDHAYIVRRLTVLLVRAVGDIEVADSSLRYDLDVKLPLYARHGIPEVWIVDLQRQRLEVYRRPEDRGYLEKHCPGRGENVSPTALAGCGFVLEDFF